MKRLLLVAAALALLAGASWAQTWTSTAEQSPDTVWVKVNVHMIGAQWTFNVGGEGSDHSTTAPTLVWSVTADTVATEDSLVHPCDVLHEVFWIENTGGVTLDFNTYFDEGLSGPTWSHDNSNITCATINAEDTVGGAYAFETSDGAVSGPSSWTVLPEDEGSTDEYENLMAEDPTEAPTPDDGSWEAEADQVEYHLEFVMPMSSSTTATQSLYVCVIGKISD